MSTVSKVMIDMFISAMIDPSSEQGDGITVPDTLMLKVPMDTRIFCAEFRDRRPLDGQPSATSLEKIDPIKNIKGLEELTQSFLVSVIGIGGDRQFEWFATRVVINKSFCRNEFVKFDEKYNAIAFHAYQIRNVNRNLENIVSPPVVVNESPHEVVVTLFNEIGNLAHNAKLIAFNPTVKQLNATIKRHNRTGKRSKRTADQLKIIANQTKDVLGAFLIERDISLVNIKDQLLGLLDKLEPVLKKLFRPLVPIPKPEILTRTNVYVFTPFNTMVTFLDRLIKYVDHYAKELQLVKITVDITANSYESKLLTMLTKDSKTPEDVEVKLHQMLAKPKEQRTIEEENLITQLDGLNQSLNWSGLQSLKMIANLKGFDGLSVIKRVKTIIPITEQVVVYVVPHSFKRNITTPMYQPKNYYNDSMDSALENWMIKEPVNKFIPLADLSISFNLPTTTKKLPVVKRFGSMGKTTIRTGKRTGPTFRRNVKRRKIQNTVA